MIASLTGAVEDVEGRVVTLDAGGVGYEVRCSSACVAGLEKGRQAHVVVYTDVKDDAINLYGFADRLEKQAFMLLMQVKGVGARSASDILSHMDKLDLLRAIGAGDLAMLQRVKGVGRKTAERIVVELKDKVGEFVMQRRGEGARQPAVASSAFEDALQALIALGFARREAEQALAKVEKTLPQGETDSGLIVKEALKYV